MSEAYKYWGKIRRNKKVAFRIAGPREAHLADGEYRCAHCGKRDVCINEVGTYWCCHCQCSIFLNIERKE